MELLRQVFIYRRQPGPSRLFYRLPGFFDDGNLVILTNGFAKKSQKTPLEQITLAEQRKNDYLRRKNYG